MRATSALSAVFRAALAALLCWSPAAACAEVPLKWHASLDAQTSSGRLAPYMLGSWNEGRFFEATGIWQEAGIEKQTDLAPRFSWGAGADYIVGSGSRADYRRWIPAEQQWTSHRVGRNAFRIQQLYAEVKYRSLLLTAGMKYSRSGIVDPSLSSGDLTRSNNATPIPGLGLAMIDFRDIPFTKGWVQVNAELMYGKMTDTRFDERQFNFYSGLHTTGLWYNYKRLYFRTNPAKPFQVVVGMQAAGMFGGSTYQYQRGVITEESVRGFRWSYVTQMLIPREGGEAYYEGSHLGSWDLKATYDFRNGSKLKAYFEWPWEDGSGIGKMNGWDGLWGLQYDFPRKGIVSKVAVEYLDFTNQSGPIHFAPADHPDGFITGHADGADDYYNNGDYGAYANYGMGIGSPFLLAPIYNLSGMTDYLHNRARGFHAAVEGNPSPRWSWRAMLSWQKAGGNGWTPVIKRLHSTSAMIEATALPFAGIPQLQVSARVAIDRGDLRGNNFGARLAFSYSGDFTIKSKKK